MVYRERDQGVKMSSLSTQVGGDHYKTLAIQPVEYITKNGLGYTEGCVIKYVTRHKAKGGAEDIKKAIHFLNLLLELEYGEKEEKAEECKARFLYCIKTTFGDMATVSSHFGQFCDLSKDELSQIKDNDECQSCRAAASLALVALTKP